MQITTKTVDFSTPLYLDSGRILEPYRMIYETYGELNEDKSNVIIVCHAFSGSHHAAGRYEDDKKPGWWDALVGDGKAVDTSKYFVICVNVIGSCYGSTGPGSENHKTMRAYGLKFPVITVRDMVRAQKTLFATLGIFKVKAIIGGSMGGMQALSFAVEYPDFAETVIPMATTHATSPWVIALNKVAQSALLADPAFDGGNYNPDDIKQNGLAGLSAARMAGYLKYISPEGMNGKFGRGYVANDGLFELFGQFEVERYLDYNGENFVKWFDPLSFLYLSKAINIFDVSYGYDSLEDALSRIHSSLYLLAFKGDTMFFPSEMQHIVRTMQKKGMDNVSYICIDSDYGHDAFLVEVEKFADLVSDILEKKI
ncbi:MAG TPA: homoserine O-acetyltransferase [Campylobacterales bacterium]|nr:homoserine O-acetyltransferase [Campylobacterales bacterium]